MTLVIEPGLKYERTHLFKMLHKRRGQLELAYVSSDPIRIRKAKISLARILLELAQSPELGPQRPFHWGHRLFWLFYYQTDPFIPPQENQSCSWFEAANLLMRSIPYGSDILSNESDRGTPAQPTPPSKSPVAYLC